MQNWLNQDFNSFMKEKPTVHRNTYLNKANRICKTLFDREYSDCLTYQQKYVIKGLARGMFK